MKDVKFQYEVGIEEFLIPDSFRSFCRTLFHSPFQILITHVLLVPDSKSNACWSFSPPPYSGLRASVVTHLCGPGVSLLCLSNSFRFRKSQFQCYFFCEVFYFATTHLPPHQMIYTPPQDLICCVNTAEFR